MSKSHMAGLSSTLPGKALVVLLCGWLSLPALRAEDEQDAYDSATNSFNFQEYELAAVEYEKLAGSAKDDVIRAKAAFYLAECQFRLKKYEQAAALFRDYLVGHKADARRAEGQFRISECFFFMEDYAKATTAYARYVEENPSHQFVPLALYSGASAAMETGQFDDALRGYQRLLKDFPDHDLVESAAYNTGWVHFKANQFDQAAGAFSGFAEKYPESKYLAEALLRAADSRFRLEDYKQALLHYNQVLAKGGGAFKSDAHQGIAWSYYKLQEFEKAANSFMTLGRTLANSSKKAESFYQAIQSYYSAGKFEPGISAAGELLSSCADTDFVGDALYWRGLFQRKSGQLEKSAADLQAALKAGKTRVGPAEIQMELGNVYVNLKKYDEAVAILKDAAGTEKKPELLNQVYYDLSKALHQQGKTDEALAVAQKIKTDAGKGGELEVLAQFSMGEFEFARKQYDAARGHYEKVLSTRPQAALRHDALYRLGWCFKFLAKPREAVAAFSKMDLADKSNRYAREVTFLLGGLHEDLADAGAAETSYRHLLEARGDYTADAYLALAEMQFKAKKLESAAKTLAEFISGYAGTPQEAEGRYMLAEVAYESGQAEEAAKNYGLVIESKNPALLEAALYGRAWIHYEKQRHKEALADLDALLAKFPKTTYASSAVQLQGKIHLAQNDPARAREVFLKALDKGGPSADNEAILVNLAGVEADAKNNDRALELYDQFISQYPKSAKLGRVLYDKGWLLMRIGKPADAAAIFKQFKQQFPDGELISDVEFALGELAYDAGRYPEATRHYEACREDGRYKDKSLYKSAWCAFKQEKFADAARLFAVLASECPESPLRLEGRYREGLAQFKGGRFPEAFAALEIYLKAGSGDAFHGEALYNAAKVAEKVGKADIAQDHYERYVKQYGKGDYRIQSEFGLAQLLVQKKDYQEARRHFQEVLKDKTHHLALEAQYGEGETYYHTGDYDLAIKSYLKTLLYKDGQAWQSASLYRIAQAHKNMKREDKAAYYLKKLLDDYPQAQESKVAADDLHKLKG